MKKIAIALVVIAALLAVGCSSAAVKVDLAGNPETLAGTWSGTITASNDRLVEPEIFTKIEVDTDVYYDYQGTWDNTHTTIPKANYSEVDLVAGVTYTDYYIYFPVTTVTTTSRVIAATGSYVETETQTSTIAARAAITVPTNTATAIVTYTVYNAGGVPTTYASAASVPAQEAGVQTTVTVTTVGVSEEASGMFKVTTDVVSTVTRSGALFPAASSTSSDVTVTPSVYTHVDFDHLGFYVYGANNLLDTEFIHTVSVAAKDPVFYQNTIVYTYVFVIAADGTYTLTKTWVETQAAADASVETADTYAAPARVASVWTSTSTFAGVVAAYTYPANQFANEYSEMVLSGKAVTYSGVGTGDWEVDPTRAPDVDADFVNEVYVIRFLQGDGKKDDVIKTRMVITGLKLNDQDGTAKTQNVVLDKAIVAEE